MAKRGEIKEEGSGPYRGVNAREYTAIEGQFRHLMNCLPAAAGVFTRFGADHVGQAASFKSTIQNLSTMTGYHDECDHKIVRQVILRWNNPPPDGYPQSTVARFIWSNIPQAAGNITKAAGNGFCWMQLKNSVGNWITSIRWAEVCPDDPQIQTVMLNNTQYFCTGYGPLYLIKQVVEAGVNNYSVVEAQGVDRNAVNPVFKIPYIMGPLPNPIAITVVKNNVLAFIGVRNGDTVLKGSSLLKEPTLATPEKQMGGSLNLGQPYYFRVTMVDEYGVESKGSNEVFFLPNTGPDLEGERFTSGAAKACQISWLSVPHGVKYRVYVGIATMTYGVAAFDYFETVNQSFTYGGQAGLGARVCPTISGPMKTQFGKAAGRTVCFFSPQDITDGDELALEAANFCQLKSDKPEDINDNLVAGVEVFGGLLLYTHKSITHIPLGPIIDQKNDPFEPLELAQGTGLASTRARVNVKGREYFIDGCGKGVFMLPGAQAPVEVSTSWSEYFEGVSQSGLDPFRCDVNRLKYAHACDDSRQGQIMFWLPMGNNNHRMINVQCEFVGVYRYENVIPQREKDATDWWAFFGKGAWYDPWGCVNVLEHGYAYSSADELDDGNGKNLWLGGYYGYSSMQSVDFMDAVQRAAVLSASTTAPPTPVTTVRFDLNAHPGFKQRNDHVGAWMEIIDNLSAIQPPAAGTVLQDQRRYIVAIRDVYWNNCDTAWTAGAAGTDSKIIKAGAVWSDPTDGIDGRGCERVQLKGSGAPGIIAYSPVVSTNLVAGDVIRVWLKLSWPNPLHAHGVAEVFEFMVDDTAGCPTPLEWWSVPELLNNKWTECVFTVTAPRAGVISIGIRSKAGAHVNDDLLFIDQVDLQGLNGNGRYVDMDLASPFVDVDGATATPTTTMGVRIYWDICDRRAMVFGTDSPADAEIFWNTFTAKYRCSGEQTIRFLSTADADGWDPLMLVMSMPRSDAPTVLGVYPGPPGVPVGTPVLPPNHLPDAALALIENLYPYWSYSSPPGHNDVRAETLWIGRYGGPLYVIMEGHDRSQLAFYSFVTRGKLERLKGT